MSKPTDAGRDPVQPVVNRLLTQAADIELEADGESVNASQFMYGRAQGIRDALLSLGMVIRLDGEGRDVTDTPGLWDCEDTWEAKE